MIMLTLLVLILSSDSNLTLKQSIKKNFLHPVKRVFGYEVSQDEYDAYLLENTKELAEGEFFQKYKNATAIYDDNDPVKIS